MLVVPKAPINQFLKVCMGIDTVVVWFNELEVDLLRSEISFDYFLCLILLHYVKFWFVTLTLKILEVFV